MHAYKNFLGWLLDDLSVLGGCEGFCSPVGVLLQVENSRASHSNNPHKESLVENPSNLTEETLNEEVDATLSSANLQRSWHLHASGW